MSHITSHILCSLSPREVHFSMSIAPPPKYPPFPTGRRAQPENAFFIQNCLYLPEISNNFFLFELIDGSYITFFFYMLFLIDLFQVTIERTLVR